MPDDIHHFKGDPLLLRLHPGSGFYEILFMMDMDYLRQCGYGPESFKQSYRFASRMQQDQFATLLETEAQKTEGSKDIQARLTVDTRYGSMGRGNKTKVAISFEDGKDLHLFTVSSFERTDDATVNCTLVVDLGNTRSFALLLDDVEGLGRAAGLRMQKLPLKSYSRPQAGGSEGVFDSYFVLEYPERFGPEVKARIGEQGFGEPLSFMRLGKEAVFFRGQVASDHSVEGRYSLSTPKRYFWERDAEIAGWKTRNPLPKSGGATRRLGGPLASVLGEEFGTPSDQLPPAAMLSAMIVELMEQAERYLNSPAHLQEAELKRCRRIGTICITYPAGWSKGEARAYRETILAGAQSFCALRALPPPVVDVSCDEASAVMLSYVYSEIVKYGAVGENWIRAVGRREFGADGSRLPPSARVAVIDVGGGTSDLVIADISDRQEGSGILLEIGRIYQDGVNRAGDEFLRNVVENVLLRQMGERFFPGKEKVWRRLFSDLLRNTDSYNSTGDRASWARSLWFPLAIEAVEAADSGAQEIGLVDAGVFADFGRFRDEVEKWARANKQALGDRPSDIGLPSPSDLAHQIRVCAMATFGPIARVFGAAITAFECDIVLFAGKASEFREVRELFQASIPIPEQKFIPLKDYFIGDWCPLAQNGVIADAKVTTVLGAALYSMANTNSPRLTTSMRLKVGSAPGIDEAGCFWGRVTRDNLRFRNQDAILSREKNEAWVDLDGTVFIGKRRFPIENQDAAVAFELRVRPDVRTTHGIPEAGSRVRLEKHVLADGTVFLNVVEAAGVLRDGTPLRVEHVEIRPRILVEDEFWLDSGRILTQDWALSESRTSVAGKGGAR